MGRAPAIVRLGAPAWPDEQKPKVISRWGPIKGWPGPPPHPVFPGLFMPLLDGRREARLAHAALQLHDDVHGGGVHAAQRGEVDRDGVPREAAGEEALGERLAAAVDLHDAPPLLLDEAAGEREARLGLLVLARVAQEDGGEAV